MNNSLLRYKLQVILCTAFLVALAGFPACGTAVSQPPSQQSPQSEAQSQLLSQPQSKPETAIAPQPVLQQANLPPANVLNDGINDRIDGRAGEPPTAPGPETTGGPVPEPTPEHSPAPTPDPTVELRAQFTPTPTPSATPSASATALAPDSYDSTPQPGAATQQEETAVLETPDAVTYWSEMSWTEPTWLTDMVDSLPLSIAATGVWLSNPAAALEFAGLQPAKSVEDRIARTPEQHEQYQLALDGVAPSGIQISMGSLGQEWQDTFGFDEWDVRAMAETGEVEFTVFETNVLSGRFDRKRIVEKLTNLDYERRFHSGFEYLSLPAEIRPDLSPTLIHLLNAHVRNVFTDGDILLTAPSAEGLEEVLSVRAGEEPSLRQHHAFGDLVFTMPDSFYMSILSRKVVLQPEHPRFRQFEPRDDWGSLGDWKALAASFSRPSPESKKITLALWYDELSKAQEASDELTARFGTFVPTELQPMVILQDMCRDHWKTVVVESPRGAALTVSCQLDTGPSSHGLGNLMLNILFDGTLAFLVS